MAPNKPNVRNIMTLYNTVGAELIELFQAHGVTDWEQQIRISNLTNRERLTKKERQKAVDILGLPSIDSYLFDFQNNYNSEKERFAPIYKAEKKEYSKLKKILPLLRGEFTDNSDMLGDIIDYLGFDTLDELHATVKQNEALFRKQKRIKINHTNLYAWLRRGEIDFKRQSIQNYNEEALQKWAEGKAWKDKIGAPSYFLSLPNIFASMGVFLALVPSLPNTVFGSVRWFNNIPLIQISDRGQDLATCWVTLFHEIGHVLLHRNEQVHDASIYEKNVHVTSKEKEANTFANRLLFNGDKLRKTIFERNAKGVQMKASEIAKEFDVDPLFSAYWLLKARHNPTFQQRIHIDFTAQYQ